MTQLTHYYYAQGKRVPLEPDPDHIAVDLGRADTGLARELENRIRSKSVRLSGDIYLAEREKLPQDAAAHLEADGPLLPVFRHHGVLVVVLPELRVETSSARQRDAVDRFLGSSEIPTEILSDRGHRLVLRPTTRSGIDSLWLANRLHEVVKPKLVQAHFLRLVPTAAAVPEGGGARKPNTKVR